MGGAVTTDSVMISRICIALRVTANQRRPYNAAVHELSDSQLRTRERVEAVIGLMAPALDAVLAAGERVSRLVEPEDHGYYPPRPLEDSGDSPQPGRPAS